MMAWLKALRAEMGLPMSMAAATCASCSHGEDIPIGARVVAVADAYDAIVTDRSYRRGRTSEEAIAIIREAADRQFDPAVVSAFERVMSKRDAEPEVMEVPRPRSVAVGAGASI